MCVSSERTLRSQPLPVVYGRASLQWIFLISLPRIGSEQNGPLVRSRKAEGGGPMAILIFLHVCRTPRKEGAEDRVAKNGIVMQLFLHGTTVN